MTGSLDPHEPTPEFRAHLAWQLESALRRESRLAPPVSRGPSVRVAALVVVALAVGGAAGVASGHVQDARQRSNLVDNVRAEMQVAQTRLQLARAEYDDVRARYEIGTAGRESVLAAEQQMRAVEASLKRLQLDRQEIQATSAPPRNELTAPLVSDRDFVRHRLLIEMESAQRAMAAAEQRLAEARSRMNIGLASPASVLDADAELARVRAQMALLQSKLTLRQRYLRREIQQEEIATALRQAELTLAIEGAERELTAARARLSQLRGQVKLGIAGQLEAKRAELTVLEREVELQRIRREIEALRGGR